MVFIMTVPKCPVCKTSKNVVFELADVQRRKTWFHIEYCTKCYTVIVCHFQGKLLNKEESDNLEELKKMEKTKTWKKHKSQKK